MNVGYVKVLLPNDVSCLPRYSSFMFTPILLKDVSPIETAPDKSMVSRFLFP